MGRRTEGGRGMKYEVVEIEEKRVRGLKVFVGRELYETDGIADLWMELVQRIDLKSMGDSYGIMRNFDIEHFEFDYMAGIEEGIIGDCADIVEWVIPGGRYARFSQRGPMTRESIAKLYDDSFKTIFAEGLMDSTRGINSFELYSKNYIVLGDSESTHHLLIPVGKK